MRLAPADRLPRQLRTSVYLLDGSRRPWPPRLRRAVSIVRSEPVAVGSLSLAERLRAELRRLGGAVGESCCHIVPLIIGEARAAAVLSRRLEEQGLLVTAIRPPSVPEGSARLRISVTAGHSEADVEQLWRHFGTASHPKPEPYGLESLQAA